MNSAFHEHDRGAAARDHCCWCYHLRCVLLLSRLAVCCATAVCVCVCVCVVLSAVGSTTVVDASRSTHHCVAIASPLLLVLPVCDNCEYYYYYYYYCCSLVYSLLNIYISSVFIATLTTFMNQYHCSKMQEQPLCSFLPDSRLLGSHSTLPLLYLGSPNN